MSILEQCFVYIHTVYTWLYFLTKQFSGVCLFQICALDIVGAPLASLSLFCSSKHGRILGGESQDHISRSRHRRQPEDLMCVL